MGVLPDETIPNFVGLFTALHPQRGASVAAKERGSQ
jgi:hypothetical protein